MLAPRENPTTIIDAVVSTPRSCRIRANRFARLAVACVGLKRRRGFCARFNTSGELKPASR